MPCGGVGFAEKSRSQQSTLFVKNIGVMPYRKISLSESFMRVLFVFNSLLYMYFLMIRRCFNESWCRAGGPWAAAGALARRRRRSDAMRAV